MGRILFLCLCNLFWCSKVVKIDDFKSWYWGGRRLKMTITRVFQIWKLLLSHADWSVCACIPFILLVLSFVHLSPFGKHNWAIGPVGEGIDSPMTPSSGVRAMLEHPDHFPFLFCHLYLFYLFYSFYFSLIFLTPLFLLFWKNIKHQLPLFFPLEFNDDFIYFIWIIYDRLLESWNEGLMKIISVMTCLVYGW